MKFSTILTLALSFLTEAQNEPLKCWECKDNFELGKDQVPKCDETVKRTCPNDGNYDCVTINGIQKGGSPIQFKKCVKSDKNFCQNLNMTYNLKTCQVCSSDFCNNDLNHRECWFSDPSKEFYDQSDDKVACFDENYNCLNAQRVQNNTLSLIRRCIRPTETQKTCNDYKKENFTCSVCEKNYCNRDEFVNEISCYKCKGDCNQVEKKLCPGYTDFKCISINIKGDDGGYYEKIKGCVVKTKDYDPCEKYAQNGSSCRVCDKKFCNTEFSICQNDLCGYKDNGIETDSLDIDSSVPKSDYNHKIGALKCYKCLPALTFCKAVKVDCSKNSSCLLAEGFKKGKIIKRKECVLNKQSKSICNNYKNKGFDCIICNEDFCNRKRSGPARKCFTCDDKFCKSQRQEICPDYDDFSCLSVKYPKFSLKGNGSVILRNKKCVVKYGAKMECDLYKEKFNTSECSICDDIDLCNRDPEVAVKSNKKRYSLSNYRLLMTVFFLILLK